MKKKRVISSLNYVTIQSWMITELDLKGNDLILYAVIYGFSQVEGCSFNGSLQYLADWCNSTKQGVLKSLKKLIENGHIIKKENEINGVKLCSYAVNSVERGIKQSLMGYATEFNDSVKLSLPNNIVNNIEDNIDIYIANNDEQEVKKDKKAIFGKYRNVRLSEKELSKLNEEFGETFVNECITTLDEYIEMRGTKYKSHYLAIKKWVVDAVKQKGIRPKNSVERNEDYEQIGIEQDDTYF